MTGGTVDEVWDDWKQAVNMTAGELEEWLGTDESQGAGDKGDDGGESTGHQSGRHIVELLRTKKARPRRRRRRAHAEGRRLRPPPPRPEPDGDVPGRRGATR